MSCVTVVSLVVTASVVAGVVTCTGNKSCDAEFLQSHFVNFTISKEVNKSLLFERVKSKENVMNNVLDPQINCSYHEISYFKSMAGGILSAIREYITWNWF